jgi:hypothetical protein
VKVSEVVERLETHVGLDGPPTRLRTTVENILISDFGLPPIQAAERAEALEPRIVQEIGLRASANEKRGTLARLVLVGEAQISVMGWCHVLPGDGPEIAIAKKNRRFVPAFLTAIRDLTFSEFEEFSSRVLKELGAHTVNATRRSGDQGIDFYGEMNFGKFQPAPAPFFQLAHDISVYFAGQSKHYPRRTLGPDVVRELAGAVAFARTKNFSREDGDPFIGMTLRPLSPLVTLLFTTGDISTGAAALCAQAGIIARSGEQLAVFLAERGIGIVNQDGEMDFDEAGFRRWLFETRFG